MLEAKQSLKTESSAIDGSQNLKQNAPGTSQGAWQEGQRPLQPPQGGQLSAQVSPAVARNESGMAYSVALPEPSSNETAPASGSWSFFGKKQSKQQQLLEREENEKKGLLKNATQSLDTMLKTDSQLDAIKQMTTALGIDPTRDELFKNATNAIEGLINLRAEEMVKKKEE